MVNVVVDKNTQLLVEGRVFLCIQTLLTTDKSCQHVVEEKSD